MRKLTSLQKKVLEKSPHVLRTTDSHVIYSAEFKLLAIKRYDEGFGPAEIFEEYGLKFDFFNHEYYPTNLKRWRKIFQKHGESGFSVENRGREGRPSRVTIDDLSLNELKALVEIQRDVIEQLKKKKALAKKK